MLRANRLRAQSLRAPYSHVSSITSISSLPSPCKLRTHRLQDAAPGGSRAYSDDAKETPRPNFRKTTSIKPLLRRVESVLGKTPVPKAEAASPARAKAASPPKAKTASPPKAAPEPDAADSGVIHDVFKSLKALEKSYASINRKLLAWGGGSSDAAEKSSDTEAASKTEKTYQDLKADTNRLGSRLKNITGTLDVLKTVLRNQQIPLLYLAKHAGPEKKSPRPSQPKATEKTRIGLEPTNGKGAGKGIATKKPKTPKVQDAQPLPQELGAKPDRWISLADRMKAPDTAASIAAGASALAAASSGSAPRATPPAAGEKKKKKKAGLNVQVVKANSLELTPVDVPDMPVVPKLAYGLDRVIFNPGVYRMQDPHSRVYNFDPYLQSIMPINEFDFNALKKYVTSSKDKTLISLAAKLGQKYSGSTSSMTSMLSHFHYLLSAWRPVNASRLSRRFSPETLNYTQIMRAPAATFLKLNEGVYAIDADKEYDMASILSMLGKSMEKQLTLPKDEFERYRRSKSDQISEEERNADEAFHYTTMGDFLMRSQLDAYDPRLPGTGMFDLKTRAVITIRMDAQGFQKGLGYEIRDQFGQWESFEREYFDMIRSAFLKYSLQVRMGRMDGIFVAFHNTQRIFGFQYISLNEMDDALHGTTNRDLGDQEFKLSLHLLNKALDRATERFPGRSLRLHVETRPTEPPLMYIFAKPVDPEEIDRIQSSNQDEVAKFEEQILGIVANESETRDKNPATDTVGSEVEQGSSQEADVSGEDAKDAQWQTQAFWEEMHDKVDAAIEDDALGVNHVREAIQDALQQSGLLEASSLEEAQGYVDSLLEALIRDQATEARATETSSTVVEKGTLTINSDGIEDVKTTADAGLARDDEAFDRTTSEKDALLDTEEPYPLGSEKRELNLKELILQIAMRVDEQNPESNTKEVSDEAITSESSKLTTFERILSELVTKSRQPEAGSNVSEPSSSESATAAEDTTDVSQEAMPNEAASGSTTTGGSQETAKNEADRDEDDEEILGMHLTVRHMINGKYTNRPSPKLKTWDWKLEYQLEELPKDRARKIYDSVKRRRQKVFDPEFRGDRSQDWYRMFAGKLDEMSAKGRKYRQETDKLERKLPVYVVDQEEPMAWEDAFGHKKDWKPQPWEVEESKKGRDE